MKWLNPTRTSNFFGKTVKEILYDGEKITGVLATSNEDEEVSKQLQIQAKVTVGADGRNSIVAKKANFSTRT